jgi:hypothetical protein
MFLELVVRGVMRGMKEERGAGIMRSSRVEVKMYWFGRSCWLAQGKSDSDCW